MNVCFDSTRISTDKTDFKSSGGHTNADQRKRPEEPLQLFM